MTSFSPNDPRQLSGVPFTRDTPVLDAPETIASMLVDGEFSLRAAKDAFISPSALSPFERDGMKERMQRDFGKTGAVAALIDVSLNPWVWGAFLFSPMGAKALQRGTSMFALAPAKTAYARTEPVMWHALGLATGNQTLAGTRALPVLHQADVAVRKLYAEFGEFIGPSRRAVEKRLGVKNLDYHRMPDGPKKDQTKRLMAAIWGSLEGLDQKFVNGAGDVIEKQVNANLDDVIRSIGGAEAIALRDSLKTGFNVRFLRMYGVDSAENVARLKKGENLLDLGEDAVDPAKIRSHIRGGTANDLFRRRGHGPEDATNELLRQLAPDGKLRQKFEAGEITASEFDDFVRKSIVAEPNYVPRNLWEQIDEHGNMVTPLHAGSAAIRESVAKRVRGAIAPTQRSKARVSTHADLHPDDLAYFDEQFVGTDSLKKRVNAARGKLKGSAESGSDVRFLRFDPDASVRLYERDTAASYAWHSVAPNDEVLLSAKNINPNTGKPLDLPEIDDPRLSLADILADDYVKIQDPYARNEISHFFIPKISGIYNPQRLGVYQMMNSSKKALFGLMEGPVGQMFESAGGAWGKEIRERFRRLADPSLGPREGISLSRNLAKYLYNTHLGLSPPSIVLNLMQPWMLAATWIGGRDVGAAYLESMGQMFKYAQIRAKQGFSAQQSLRDKAIREAFGEGVNHAGEDIIGITGNPFNVLDEGLAGIGSDVTESFIDKYSHYTMWGFQKSEWLNRATVYNAMKRAYRRQGLQPSGAQFTQDVRQAVQRTQFGNDLLNTPPLFSAIDPELNPMAFMANPVMRQFMSFMTRTATGTFLEGPQLGGRTSFIAGAARDWTRALGISAIGYETWKLAVGESLAKRGTILSGATDVFGGEEFLEQDNPFPIPPVIDIPIQFIKGLGFGDVDALRQAAGRSIPGGLPLSRILGALPDIGMPSGVDLQRSYTDWSVRSPDGRVPIFKSDGSLVDFQHPGSVIFKALGVDPGNRFGDTAALDRYLVVQRDEMLAMRKEAVNALLGGNMAKFKQVQAEHMKRFGVPLTIDRQRLDNAIKLRTVPRTERLLDRVSPEIRQQFAGIAEQTNLGRLGLQRAQPGVLQQGTSGSREGQRTQTVSGDAEKAAEAESFGSFESF